MKYSSKDYLALKKLKEDVSFAKGEYINSMELYIIFQLKCCSNGIDQDTLLKNNYIQFEKMKRLYIDMLNKRHNLEVCYIRLVNYQDYLRQEYVS